MPHAESPGTSYRFGLFEADRRTGELRKQGRTLKLRGRPFDILILLLDHQGDIVTREELRQQLWAADTFVDFDHGLNSAVNRLRETLGDSAESPRFIETLPRRGYRFIAPIDIVPRGYAVSPPLVPGVPPPIAIPRPSVVFTPVNILQFLIVLFVQPSPVPRLINWIAVGPVVAELNIVRSRLELPLLLPSMVT